MSDNERLAYWQRIVHFGVLLLAIAVIGGMAMNKLDRIQRDVDRLWDAKVFVTKAR